MAIPESESEPQIESTPAEQSASASATAVIPRHTPMKLADHPHWWTIILSLVAIVVSGLSYMESHSSRLLSEEVNRPLVRVVSVHVIGPILGKIQPNGDRYPNAYHLLIRNSGRAFADNVRVAYKAQLEDSRVGGSFLKFSSDEGATINSDKIGDLAPDDEYELSLWASVLKVNPTIPFGDHEVNMVSLVIKGDVEYTNPINKTIYRQPFCYMDAGTMGRFEKCVDAK
jgi:hypothetical protein